MYKICVRNLKTKCEWWEYGFTHYMMKRLHFLLNNTETYEIIWCFKCYYILTAFKKCLLRETIDVNNNF